MKARAESSVRGMRIADGAELDAAVKVEAHEMLEMHASHPADAKDANAKTV